MIHDGRIIGCGMTHNAVWKNVESDGWWIGGRETQNKEECRWFAAQTPTQQKLWIDEKR